MDDYPYATLGADGWFCCDGLHHQGFLTLLRGMLHRFGYTGISAYRGHSYRQFGLGRCKVHVEISAHFTNSTMMAWFTMAQGDDLDDALERAAHQALTEFCERHLQVLDDTVIVLLPFRTRPTRCGVSAWPPLATPSFRLTMRVGRSRHATPST
jgi:hypothetical protein